MMYLKFFLCNLQLFLRNLFRAKNPNDEIKNSSKFFMMYKSL